MKVTLFLSPDSARITTPTIYPPASKVGPLPKAPRALAQLPPTPAWAGRRGGGRGRHGGGSSSGQPSPPPRSGGSGNPGSPAPFLLVTLGTSPSGISTAQREGSPAPLGPQACPVSASDPWKMRIHWKIQRCLVRPSTRPRGVRDQGPAPAWPPRVQGP